MFCSTVVKVLLLWPVSPIFIVVYSKINFFKFSIGGKCSKCLKYAVLSCFKQNYCISGMPQVITMQFFAQQWWKLCCCDQFHTYSQWFTAKFIFFNFSIAGKCWKCWKYSVLRCFKQNYCISVCLKLFPCNFLLNSGESHVVVTSFTHNHSGLQQNLIFFKIFSSWKVSKCLK